MPRPLSLYGGRISVTEILRDAGYQDFSMIPAHVLEKARVRGVAVHKWNEIETKAPETLEGVPLPDEIAPYVLAWRKWKLESSFEVESAESQVIDEFHDFGGTIDLLGKINGQPAIVDYKARYAITPEIGPQLAGYEVALGDPEPHLRFALLLRANGTYLFEPFTDRGDRDAFLSANYVAHWKLTHGIVSLKEIRSRS